MVTVSYKLIAAVASIAIVLAVGAMTVGKWTNHSELTLPAPFPQLLRQGAEAFDMSAIQTPTQQDSASDEQFLAIDMEIEDLWKELDSVKSRVSNIDILGSVSDGLSTAQSKIAVLEQRIDEFSQTENTPSIDNESAMRLDQLAASIGLLDARMDNLEKQINDLREEIEAVKQQQQDIEPEAVVAEAETTPEPEEIPEQLPQQAEEPAVLEVMSLAASANKVSYKPGESITVSGRTDANVPVDAQVIDENKNIVFSARTNSDSTGVFRIGYSIPSDAVSGMYNIDVRAGDKSIELIVSIQSAGNLSVTSESGLLTMRLEQSVYTKGDYVSVDGEAPSRGTVVVTITPPSGSESVGIVKANTDGEFQRLFQLTLDASSGEWIISATYDGETVSLTIKVL